MVGVIDDYAGVRAAGARATRSCSRAPTSGATGNELGGAAALGRAGSRAERPAEVDLLGELPPIAPRAPSAHDVSRGRDRGRLAEAALGEGRRPAAEHHDDAGDALR